MRSRFVDKVVVVTGASSGVGRAVARALGREGAKVGLIARGKEGLEAAAAEIRGAGGQALVLPLDVADAAAVDAAADRVTEEFGGIDIWINNAMVSVFGPILQLTPDECRRVTEVNYLGYVHGTLAALLHMRPRDAGVIVQVGSTLSYRSIPLQAAYCASKAAIRGFTDSLRCELLHDRSRVRVTMVHLPAVNTPQFEVVRNKLGRHGHPVGKLFQPEVMATGILHAALHPRREYWIGSTTVLGMLAQRVAPGALDRWLAREAWLQQTTRKLPPPRKDNLMAPLPGDRGAHGPFDDEAHWFSGELWLRTHIPHVLLGMGGAAALGVWASRRVR